MDGIGLKEVEAKEIDDVYDAAIEQFGCRKEDVLAAWSCGTIEKGESMPIENKEPVDESTPDEIYDGCEKWFNIMALS